MLKQTMVYFKNLWIKFRYSHFLRLFFDGLGRLGLRVTPYYLFEENISPDNPPTRPAGFKCYEVGFWGPEEIKAMAKIPGRPFSEKFLLQRLKDGHKCLGLKKDNNLAAFTWCNLKEAKFKYQRFSLKKDEAYLFDAYTLMPYRGQGLAPFLRYYLYRELEKIGRTKLYSYSDYFNTSAVRFKLKLEAKKVKLYLTVELFGKWHFNLTLKDYQK